MVSLFLSAFFITGVQDDGKSPLDKALAGGYSKHCDVPLYLINNGYGNEQDKAKLLCKGCSSGNLDVVKELVEQHKVDPTGEHSHV